MAWGILAPDTIISPRRQQNLGLAASVRYFNDRAAPGLGGMWFPMPIIWSVLAVSIAEELGRPALPVGNAVEALMMRQAKDGPADRRVRGTRKMQGLNDWSFRNLTRRGTYVVQPIRMAMVQPLVALGFVHGSRYGAFRIHDAGLQMLNLPQISEFRDELWKWARGSNLSSHAAVISGLAPTKKVPDAARKLILARLIDGDDFGSMRRRDLVALGTGPDERQLEYPDPISGLGAAHWTDLRAGAAFIDLRNAALAVLDQLENRLLQMRDNNEPVRLTVQDGIGIVGQKMNDLRQIARCQGDRIEAGGEPFSIEFMSEISMLDDMSLLRRLAERDGTVITWRGDGHLCLGPAAGALGPNGNPDDESKPLPNDGFAPQLFRLYNLHCLATELAGKGNPGCRDAHSQEVG